MKADIPFSSRFHNDVLGRFNDTIQNSFLTLFHQIRPCPLQFVKEICYSLKNNLNTLWMDDTS